MKINNIYISAFGGLKCKTLRFTDGFNVIFGENEKGKTTVMSFIKMMFYGSGRGGQQIAKNIRKKYLPWDGTPAAGYIEFEQGGRNYRLEREFKASDSADKVTVTDLDLGTRETVGGEVGTRFFGLSLAAFERSAFVGQFGFPEKDSAAESEINSKLSNIASTGDESVSFNTVNLRLENAKTELMSRGGKKGEYDKSVKRISELNEQLAKSDRFFEEYGEYLKKEEQLQTETDGMSRRAEKLKKQLDGEQDIKNAEKLKLYLNKKAELDRLNETLKLSGGGFADEMFVSKLKLCLAKLESTSERFNDRKNESERLKKSLLTDKATDNFAEKTKLDEKIRQAELKRAELEKSIFAAESELEKLECERSNARNFRKPINIPLLAAAVGLVLVFAVLLVLKLNLPAAVAAVSAAVFAVLSAVLRPQDIEKTAKIENDCLSAEKNLERLKAEKTDIEREITLAAARAEAFRAAQQISSSAEDGRKALLEGCLESIAALENEITAAKHDLFRLYSGFGNADTVEEIKLNLGSLSKAAEEQKELKKELNYIARDLGNISYDEAKQKLAALPSVYNSETDFGTLKREYEGLCEKIGNNKAALAAARAKADERLKNVVAPESIKKEIGELSEKIARQKDYCDALDTAMSVLKDSFAELRRSYGSELEKRAGSVFSELTDGAYGGMQISKEFDIYAEKKDIFGGKEIAFLSSGTSDQAYLSLRLALSSLITESAGESVPLFLDDTLAQYDDGRLQSAVNYLEKYAKKGQAIMFTCHKSVISAAENAGAESCEF